MKEKTWFDRWVDFEYERLNNLITTEIRQKLEIIEELGLENEIDKYLIKGGLITKNGLEDINSNLIFHRGSLII